MTNPISAFPSHAVASDGKHRFISIKTRLILLNFVLMFLAGGAVTSVNIANHPEWGTPCCRTLPEKVVQKNLTTAATEARNKAILAKAEMAKVRKITEANK